MLIIGIDPGISGSICFFDNGRIIKVIEMPTMTDGKKNKKQVQLICFLNESQLTKFKTNMFGQNKDYIIALNDF